MQSVKVNKSLCFFNDIRNKIMKCFQFFKIITFSIKYEFSKQFPLSFPEHLINVLIKYQTIIKIIECTETLSISMPCLLFIFEHLSTIPHLLVFHFFILSANQSNCYIFFPLFILLSIFLFSCHLDLFCFQPVRSCSETPFWYAYVKSEANTLECWKYCQNSSSTI